MAKLYDLYMLVGQNGYRTISPLCPERIRYCTSFADFLSPPCCKGTPLCMWLLVQFLHMPPISQLRPQTQNLIWWIDGCICVEEIEEIFWLLICCAIYSPSAKQGFLRRPWRCSRCFPGKGDLCWTCRLLILFPSLLLLWWWWWGWVGSTRARAGQSLVYHRSLVASDFCMKVKHKVLWTKFAQPGAPEAKHVTGRRLSSGQMFEKTHLAQWRALHRNAWMASLHTWWGCQFSAATSTFSGEVCRCHCRDAGEGLEVCSV